MGPNLLWHLGGGEGGIRHFVDHHIEPMATLWLSLGKPSLTPELKQTIIDGVLEEAAGRPVEQLERERDEVLLGLLALRARSASAAAGKDGASIRR